MQKPRTMFDKLWEQHVIHRRNDGETLLFIDRNFVHDGARNAFDLLEASGHSVRAPEQTFAFADHFVPTVDHARGVASVAHAGARLMIKRQMEYTKKYGITLFGMGDQRQGIAHIVGPEQGLTQPGLTIVCGDSHTSTHGAFGAFAFGIGTSENVHVLATQTLWQRKPRVMRIRIEGVIPFGVSSKDIILAIIARIGTAAGTGHVIEFAGSAVTAMSMDARMTLCNMAIEAGARSGMIAPDDTTYEYLAGRPYAPRNADWDRAVARWQRLPSDPDAVVEHDIQIWADEIVPTVTWGTSPEDAVPITATVPDPAREPDSARRARQERALAYMDLVPGMPMAELRIDRVFIGSCTNSRIEDLRLAAAVLKGRKAVVPAMVVPGSGMIRKQAEAEGLDQIFVDAGFEWREPGCSMCVGMNGEIAAVGERCASTSNRNFEGRQGRGSRTHLMSPAMAAAAAVSGTLTDVRRMATI